MSWRSNRTGAPGKVKTFGIPMLGSSYHFACSPELLGFFIPHDLPTEEIALQPEPSRLGQLSIWAFQLLQGLLLGLFKGVSKSV